MKLFLPLIWVFLSVVCSAQIKPIGDAPLMLEKFSFATPPTVLYPEKNKSREFPDSYEIRSKDSLLGLHYVNKETIYENDFDPQLKKPIGIEYQQQSSSSDDRLAVFGRQFFDRINIATTTGGRIKLIGAAITSISQTESENLIRYLTLRYGRPKKLKGEFVRAFEIYEWRTPDRTFRYAPIYADEKNVLKINVDQKNKTITPAKKEPHLEGYFYIISNEFIKTIPQTKNGDFAYLNED